MKTYSTSTVKLNRSYTFNNILNYTKFSVD